jgi:hypothetical protein
MAMVLTWLVVSPVVAEQPLTRLIVEKISGNQSAKSIMVIGSDFVALLSEKNELNALYNSEAGNLWLLDHQRKVSQQINRKEVQIFADKLASEVAKFEDSIASLPESQRALSMKRFEQLFEPANRRSARHVDEFVPQGRAGEFAGISCQWHDMIEHQSSGDKLVGAACLVETRVVAQGQALDSFFSDMAVFSNIVKKADTGPIQFPLSGSMAVMSAEPGMMAMKVTYNPESEIVAGVEVLSVTTEIGSIGQYQIPQGYRQKRFSKSLDQ